MCFWLRQQQLEQLQKELNFLEEDIKRVEVKKRQTLPTSPSINLETVRWKEKSESKIHGERQSCTLVFYKHWELVIVVWPASKHGSAAVVYEGNV